MMVRALIVRQVVPFLFGIACLAVLVVLIEFLIKTGLINRFIVPLPSEIWHSFGRIIVEEDVPSRFLLTCTEALVASLLLSVVGITLGVLLHRITLLRLATETWIAVPQ